MGVPATQRLDDLRRRVAEHASRAQPGGLTAPDPDTPEERWDAAQAWAHMAEFVGYWHAPTASVVRLYDGAPVPFGRTKTDAGRIHAIEIGRHREVRGLAAEVDRALDSLSHYLATIDDAEWGSRGLHTTSGVLDVGQMVERFITNHHDEHIAQHDGLAAR